LVALYTPRPRWIAAGQFALVPEVFFLTPRRRGRERVDAAIPRLFLRLDVVRRLDWHAAVRIDAVPTNAWNLITLPCVLLALLLLA